MRNYLIFLCLLFVSSGCAAVAPFTPLLTRPAQAPGLNTYEQTTVSLARANFALVSTNVVGQSKGFSLLGLINIVPPSLNKAMNRMYASAQMQLGQPQTTSHLIIERTSSYWILFGIPKIEVRADIVEFVPELRADPPADSLPERPITPTAE